MASRLAENAQGVLMFALFVLPVWLICVQTSIIHA
jgi:hypothetical protein